MKKEELMLGMEVEVIDCRLMVESFRVRRHKTRGWSWLIRWMPQPLVEIHI